MLKHKRLLALSLLAGFIAGCTLDANSLAPVIGERNAQLFGAAQQGYNAMALSERDEDSIGQSVAAAITSAHPPVANTSLQHYVIEVGFTVANATPKADGNWVFGIIESPEINAYSGPNGYVLITRGALINMRDEAELAGVLAHECAHVCNHDGLKQVKASAGKTALVSGMRAANPRLAQLAGAADTGLDVITKSGYSQPQELQADEDAVRFMYKAGYDPNSYLNFLRRMQSMGASSGGQVMSTHPGIAQRIARVDAAIRALPRTAGQPSMGATMANRFQFNLTTYASTPPAPITPANIIPAPVTPSPVTPVTPVYPGGGLMQPFAPIPANPPR